MALKNNGRLNRREVLRALSLTAAGSGAAVSTLLSGCRSGQLTPEDRERLGTSRAADTAKKPKFLITIAATGGASIVDSFLAVRHSECANFQTLNAFPDGAVTSVQGSPFRATEVSFNALGAIPLGQTIRLNQVPFVTKHKADMLVVASTGTSVNHVIAQKRAITGNGAWKNRTLQECMALEYGAGMALPNVNMSVGGYLEPGSDDGLPAYCYAEAVANPGLWPLGLDGVRGVAGAPDRELVQLARAARNDKLDPQGVFARTFAKSDRLKRWISQRGEGTAKLEALDLITRLNVLPNQPPQVPLAQYGLAESADAAKLRAVFPDYFTDSFQGQAAAAFLLIKNRISTAVTIGPNFNVILGGPYLLANPPLAFDFSHNDHRAGQAFMWNRILGVADKLIELLKGEQFDATTGESLWDRTVLYVATDFGRTRNRIGGSASFGSGHDMNNGFLMLSPMFKGNTVLGGVDPQTVMTYGFDPESGTPDPTKTLSNERDVFAGILHTLSVDTTGSGLPDARAFRKQA